MNQRANQPTIVYVGGYGRSGSTVAGMLLGMPTGWFAAGEMTRIFEVWSPAQTCSCGQRLPECPLWSEVMARFNRLLPDLPLVEAATVTRRVETMHNWRLLASLPPLPVTARYGLIWGSLFQCIADVSGAHALVDMSKSAFIHANRALALARVVGLDVRVIHLIRDPRAVVWSVLRDEERRRTIKGVPIRPLIAEKTLSSWVGTNLYQHLVWRLHRLPHARLRYERFTQDPARELARMGVELGVDFQAVIDIAVAQIPIAAQHVFTGNRIRLGDASPLRADDEAWRGQLAASARVSALLLAWPLIWRYGYPFLD